MEVYIEYALAENFCMDFCLLYAAKSVSKNRAGAGRIAVSSAAGAVFAVLFPLMGLGGLAAAAVKAASGAILCLIAGRFGGIKPYLAFTALFMALTFALGGALIALFSLTDISYTGSGGVILSSVPVGIPLFFALSAVCLSRRAAQKFVRRNIKTSVVCRITMGGSSVSVPAFFDSGNRVYRLGSPVSVIPPDSAQKLVDVSGIKTFVTVHTVAGGKKLPVFTADKVEIDYGKKVITLRGVAFCVGSRSGGRTVLHPDLAEAEKC